MARGLRVAGDVTGLQFLDETSMRHWGPEMVLNRMLSGKTFISTDASQAGREQRAHDLELNSVRDVGEGQCGVVYALVGTDTVIKIAKENKRDMLYNDCCVHKLIEESFGRIELSLRPDVNIPRFGDWVHPSNEQFWSSHLKFFPKDTKETYGLLSGRIFSLPEPFRQAIFKTFAPRQMSSTAEMTKHLAEQKNKDCLIRIYLGRRQDRQPSPNFKLRNFELLVNEAEFLRLDTSLYADTMGSALAVLHWQAGVDANDVEFVLGSAPMMKPAALASEYRKRGPDDARFIGQGLDFTRRSIGIWLLDFNQCDSFKVSKDGLKKIVDAFFWNDPYYPRPGSKNPKDQELWSIFKKSYLALSTELAPEASRSMAIEFIKSVEERATTEARSVDDLF